MKLNDEWAAAFNKSDAGAVAALYTADANALPARAPMVKGPDIRGLRLIYSECGHSPPSGT